MAEIKIEKKKKPVWPWILALVILAGIIIWMWSGDTDTRESDPGVAVEEERTAQDRRADGMTDTRDTGSDQRAADRNREGTADLSSVDQYVSFVEEHDGSMGLDHEYTKQGITSLAEALEDMADHMPQSPEVDEHVNRLKEQADRLQREKESTRHANMIRNAFVSSASVLNQFEQMNNVDMSNEVDELMASAEEVRKDELATEQSDEVDRYFSKSADVMKKMAQNIES